MAEETKQPKRVIVLAIDKGLSAPLQERLHASGLDRIYDVVVCNNNSQGQADSYETMKALEKDGKRLWMLVADENMLGGESGTTFAAQVLRNHYGKYPPDAEAIMCTGTFKGVAQAVKVIGKERGEYFNTATDGKDMMPIRIAEHIEMRHKVHLAKEAKAAEAAVAAAPKPEAPAEKPKAPEKTSLQLLEEELQGMSPQERADFWLKDMVRQERNGSSTRANPLATHDIAGNGPLRYELPDELTDAAKRIGADINRPSTLETAAIAHRLNNLDKCLKL